MNTCFINVALKIVFKFVFSFVIHMMNSHEFKMLSLVLRCKLFFKKQLSTIKQCFLKNPAPLISII